jgi:hypothetical protein
MRSVRGTLIYLPIHTPCRFRLRRSVLDIVFAGLVFAFFLGAAEGFAGLFWGVPIPPDTLLI